MIRPEFIESLKEKAVWDSTLGKDMRQSVAVQVLELIRYVQILEKAFDDAMDDAKLNSWGTTEHPWDRAGYMELTEECHAGTVLST